MAEFKIGDEVKLTRVSKKYGCKRGTITETINIYSNNELKYPNTNSKDIQLSLDPDIFENAVLYNGYIVDCIDTLGNFKETITCTEGMIRKSSK